MMTKRKIIEIEREKCTGCGLCTTACAEGALVLDSENKAVLTKEIYCDGLGACLDVCPVDALHIIYKEAEEYNSAAAHEHVLKTRGQEAASRVHGYHPAAVSESPLACGCPGTMAKEIKKDHRHEQSAPSSAPSELSQWPIQLHLVSPAAPYFNEIDLLIAADCTAFTLGSFHQDLLRGKKLVIACPKLDETDGYIEKLAELIKHNTIYSLTVAIMTVPCCSGMYHIVKEAVERSGKNIAIKKVVIDLNGKII